MSDDLPTIVVPELRTTVTPKREPTPLHLLEMPGTEAAFAWLISHGWTILRTKGSQIQWRSSHRWLDHDDNVPTGEPTEVWFPLNLHDEQPEVVTQGKRRDLAIDAMRSAIGAVAERTGISPERLVGQMIGKGRASEMCELIGLGAHPTEDHFELRIGDDEIILDQAAHARGGKLLWYAEDGDATQARGATWRDALTNLALKFEQLAGIHRAIADRCEARAAEVRAWLAARPPSTRSTDP